MSLAFDQAQHLPSGFARLQAAAEAEGFRFLERLRQNWREGGYSDDAAATLRVAHHGGALIAIGAQSRDEYEGSTLRRRMRHFYVHPAFRRQGAGRALARQLMGDAFALAPILCLRATHALSIAFWDAMGFARVIHESRTHEMKRPSA